MVSVIPPRPFGYPDPPQTTARGGSGPGRRLFFDFHRTGEPPEPGSQPQPRACAARTAATVSASAADLSSR
jgi:hypothetical protein